MKTVLAICILTLTGCAGTMFDGRFCTIATDEDVQKDIAVIADTLVPEDKKAQAELAMKLAKLGATSACEGARIVQGAK